MEKQKFLDERLMPQILGFNLYNSGNSANDADLDMVSAYVSAICTVVFDGYRAGEIAEGFAAKDILRGILSQAGLDFSKPGWLPSLEDFLLLAKLKHLDDWVKVATLLGPMVDPKENTLAHAKLDDTLSQCDERTLSKKHPIYEALLKAKGDIGIVTVFDEEKLKEILDIEMAKFEAFSEIAASRFSTNYADEYETSMQRAADNIHDKHQFYSNKVLPLAKQHAEGGNGINVPAFIEKYAGNAVSEFVAAQLANFKKIMLTQEHLMSIRRTMQAQGKLEQ